MATNDYSDQTAIFDPQTWSWPVHLIGAGGINNLVGAVLVKMGVREIHIWDDDILEQHNLPTEVGYSAAMRGQPKVAAMANLICYLCGCHTPICDSFCEPVYTIGHSGHHDAVIYTHRERVTADTELSGVVISGVDSMASRRDIWRAIQNNYLEIPFYIDARSGGEQFQIFALRPADFDTVLDYETWLFDDSEAAPLQCGARNIGYISALMAGEIGRLITLFHRGIAVRDFPITRDCSIC